MKNQPQFTNRQKSFAKPISSLVGEHQRNHFSMIKGKVAEAIIQELFIAANYLVFKYGIEHTVPGVLSKLKSVRSETAQEIRNMPDFVIQHPDTGEVCFIEVKFRSNGKFCIKDLNIGYRYDNAYIILVSKKYIKCLSVEELRSGKSFSDNCKNYLEGRSDIYLPSSKIAEFNRYVIDFFGNIPLS